MKSKETCKKISKGLKRYYQTHEHSNKGIRLSTKQKEKIRRTLTGRKNGPPSIETRRKISKARKEEWATGKRNGGYKLSKESRKKISQSRIERKKKLGYINSLATREKIRQTTILRFKDTKERKKISNTLTGRIGCNKGKQWKVVNTTKIKLANIKKARNPLIQRKKSQRMKEIWNDPEYRDNQMLKKSIWLKRRNRETGIEQKLRLSLIKYKIAFERHKSISFLRTIPDFYIEPNIAIYADGKYWHSLPDVKKRDKRIFKDLTENHYHVFRFNEYQIDLDSDWCIKVIKKVENIN